MASLSPQPPNPGHRRVKSLVKEFDEIVNPSSGSSPPSSPTKISASPSLPSLNTNSKSPAPSPNASPTRPPVPSHGRRAASISYSPSTSPFASPSSAPPPFPTSPAPLPSPPFTFKSSAFTSPHVRRASMDVSGINVAPSPLPPPIPGGSSDLHRRGASIAPPAETFLAEVPEAPEEEEEEAAEEEAKPRKLSTTNGNGRHRAEKPEDDDVFLPLSPASASPYEVKFITGTPLTPSFSPSSSPTTPKPPTSDQAHSRKHSKIHQRNLSAFFPRPGQQPGIGYGDTFDDPKRVASSSGGWNDSPDHIPVRDVPRAGRAEVSAEDAKSRATKRGHHHRHSISHNYFSFLDPTDPKNAGITSPTSYLGNGSGGAFSPSSPGHFPLPSAPTSNFLPPPSHLRPKYSKVPAPLRLLLFIVLYLPFTTQLGLALSASQIVMGALLWIWGQSGESLAVTGLGYLVVFDGIGGLSGILVEGGKGVEGLWNMWRGAKFDQGVRFPFGTKRLITLSHFSQAIYLLFSAVYVCKESVEHVLLLHGATEDEGAHGTGHGGMGHGDGGGGGATTLADGAGVLQAGIVLPVALLLLSALASLISSIVLQNHQTLSDAAGSWGLSSGRPRSARRSIISSVGNPFTLTVLLFSGGLALAHFTIPSVQLAPLDKVLALLQSLAMFYIAYPAAVATGQVLLQTAPPSQSRQMLAFAGGVQDIEAHPLVVSVTPPHIWQLTPHPASSAPSTSSTPSRRSLPSKDETSTLIATLQITVAEDASDEDILQLTQFARERCAPALKAAQIGEQGELTVSVSRGKKRPVVNFFEHKSLGKVNGGAEDHGHSHATGHSHEH